VDEPKIALRYFEARGRAQFIRYYLRLRNVEFADERIAIDNGFEHWLEIKKDDTLTGPFHKLPVLHWGDEQVAEMQVIADYLHRKLGDEAMLSAQDNLRHAMLRSNLYVDVMMPLGILIWAPVAFVGVDYEALAKQSLQRVKANLSTLDAVLKKWQWTESMQGRPIMLADCLLWEELDVALEIFGEPVGLESLPTLSAFHEKYRHGTAFESLLREKPCQITGNPSEADSIEAIRAAVVAA
jgi:glutathione S-transferase